jgi:hypothetical protein
MTHAQWYEDLLANWIPNDPVEPDQPWLRTWLHDRYEIVERLAPRVIVEIGVRAGYSAFAMLSAAPEAQYLGIDIRTNAHGGLVGGHEHAERILARFTGAEFLHANSQELGRLPGPGGSPIDLIHIDGDHSMEGCLHDLHLARDSGVEWALVDDTDYLKKVRQAVLKYLAGRRDVEWFHDGHRGSALFRLTP